MPARALIFSSDSKAAALLRQALQQMELAVDGCADAAATIEKLSSEKYSLVVVDAADHRERDGILRQLRCTPLNKDAVAVAILSTQTYAASAFSLGANFVLYRPLAADRVQDSLRAATRLIHRDKRRGQRTAVHADANVSLPAVESAPARLLDLSADGLCLQCDCGLPSHSKIYLRFTLPGQTRSIQLSGETLWKDTSARVGIRFINVPQSARKLLHEWLESKLSLRNSKVRIEIPPPPLNSAAGDRRSQSRHACRLGADIYRAGENVPHRCTLTDISVGGFYVEMTAPFPIATAVEFTIRTKEFKFTSAGTVQKVDRGFGMGVAFATQTPSQRAQVQQLIKIAFRDREAAGDAVLRF